MTVPRRPLALAPPVPREVRQRGRHWLGQLDSLLWELESANLSHRDRCPQPCWSLLGTIQQAILPMHRALPVESGSTAQALDLVFALQEIVQRGLVGGDAVD